MVSLVIPPSAIGGVLRYDWVDPNGIVRDLTRDTSPNLFVARGSTGLGGTAVEIADDKLPNTGGAYLRHINTSPSRLDVPIAITEDSLGDLIQAVDNVRGWFDTGDERRRTPGYFRVTRPDDTTRQLLCYYAGGLEGDLGDVFVTSVVYVVSLYAPDPYPTEANETWTVWPGSTTTLGIMNQGQLDAYPIWYVQGPASGITIVNTTTGLRIELTANGGLTLPAGSWLAIDTRPSSLRTTLPILVDGTTSHYDKLTANSNMQAWLVAGSNSYAITLSGTTGASTISVAYRARYRGALL